MAFWSHPIASAGWPRPLSIAPSLSYAKARPRRSSKAPVSSASASQCQALIEQAKAIGQEDQIRDSALHNRALEIVVAESVTHYHYETPEEARERVAQMKAMGSHMGADAATAMRLVAGGPGVGGRPKPAVNPNLKLV